MEAHVQDGVVVHVDERVKWLAGGPEFCDGDWQQLLALEELELQMVEGDALNNLAILNIGRIEARNNNYIFK